MRPVTHHLSDGTAFVSLPAAEAAGVGPVRRLPYATRVLLENVLRHWNGRTTTDEHVRALVDRDSSVSVPFLPDRVLLQDASGIPVLADLVTLAERAGAAPTCRMDLVVDHALELDVAGVAGAAAANLDREYARHADRYRFLRWAQTRFPSLRVIPPGVGICHQLNLEQFATVVSTGSVARFDTVVGTDSHTTMVNALSVAGWGVGGIEATAVALGEPILLRVPPVLGVRLVGRTRPGVLAGDIALTLASLLRRRGVVGRVVEFHGPGLATLTVPDRATIANMAPEYGATMAYFPADARTLEYLTATGRQIGLVREYLQAQQMLGGPEPDYDDLIEFDLRNVERALAGPRRPHDLIRPADLSGARQTGSTNGKLRDGAVVIASITSCTNTSNPRALAAAGLLAQRAVQRGLSVPGWTKTSFTPGSRAAADLLQHSGLQTALDELGFQVAGFGCGTCMGNSGPLRPGVSEQVQSEKLDVSAVLSGNRNFPGRIHADVSSSYLASPPIVVALALAGRTAIDLDTEPLGHDASGTPVGLADLWPSDDEIDAILALPVQHIERPNANWGKVPHPDGDSFEWDGPSGFIRRPPFTDPDLCAPVAIEDIVGARPLLVLGDDITTDHISPVGPIGPDSAAGRWLAEHGVPPSSFGSYSARRLNHDVMLRGGFANPRLHNALAPGHSGGHTRLLPTGEVLPVHEAAAAYARRRTATVVIAGRSYGGGSARDWAAKVTRLLGVRAVLAESFERIHRTNLVALGVLPVECPPLRDLALDGTEEFDVLGLSPDLAVGEELRVVARRGDRVVFESTATARIDTEAERTWIGAGGVLPRLLATANLVNRAGSARNSTEGAVMSHLFVLDLHYAGDLTRVDEQLPAHREFLAHNYANGTFLASGRKHPRTGGVILARGDRESIERIVTTDPLHQHGIAHYTITEFVPTMTGPLLDELREPAPAAVAGGDSTQS